MILVSRAGEVLYHVAFGARAVDPERTPMQLDTIFDQFVRVHPHLDDELGAQGLGLGLSIVQESMQAMGGSVTVESVEGKGTTFLLEWPGVTVRKKPATN